MCVLITGFADCVGFVDGKNCDNDDHAIKLNRICVMTVTANFITALRSCGVTILVLSHIWTSQMSDNAKIVTPHERHLDFSDEKSDHGI